ncbi:MAG: glycogen/starch synthase, partial [Cyanobacteria bacterium J06576_12]
MKILMAVSNFYPALDLGGLVQTPWELAQILTQMGHKVDVVTSNLLGSNRKLSKSTLTRVEEGISITYLNAIWSHRASGITPSVFNYCSQIANYDVIH